MSFLARVRRFLDPNSQPGTGGTAGAGTGGTATDPSPGPRPATPPAGTGSTTRLPANVEGEFQALVVRQPGATDAERALAAARYLFNENHTIRRRSRDQRKTIEAYETRNPQGSIVLHGEALANYRAYEQLGKPAELKTKLEEATRLSAEAAETKRKETRSKAAASLKWNPKTLEHQMREEGLELEIRTETGADQKAREVPYVRKAGDANATWESLEAKAARDWKDPALVAALKAAPPAQQQAAGTAAAATSATPFVQFHDNGGGNGAGSGGGSLLDKFTTQRAEAARKATNPLAPQGARSPGT